MYRLSLASREQRAHLLFQELESAMKIMNVPLRIGYDDQTTVAGSMFWIRLSGIPVQQLVDGARNHGPASVHYDVESLIPTLIKANKHLIYEIPPAPKVMAMYFPQFHRVEENDKFWGDGFTEWTILKRIKTEGIKRPLAVKEGGLGYYDLIEDEDTRKKQGQLADAAGVHGFCFYHYWFSGSAAPDHHKVMYKVTEAMLRDGYPQKTFMLSWANGPWSRRRTGLDDGSEEASFLLSQNYGDEKEWAEHFDYLLNFFLHPLYLKIRGKPVFAIYRIGHFGDKLKPMLSMWRNMAKEAGFPDLHVVNTLGNFYRDDPQTEEMLYDVETEASIHFWPQLIGSDFFTNANTASVENMKIPSLVQYWGAFTGFDRRPRDPDDKYWMVRDPTTFGAGVECSFQHMGLDNARAIDKNLFFVTAWNEWNEQAVLEPDERFRFAYLEALHKNLINMPMRALEDRRTLRDNPLCEIGGDSPKTAGTHVVLVIRAYDKQINQLKSLIYSVSAMSTPTCESNCARFIIVPTEEKSVSALRELIDYLDISHSHLKVEMIDIPPNFFSEAEHRAPRCGSVNYDEVPDLAFKNGVCIPFLDYDPKCLKKMAEETGDEILDKKRKICGYYNNIHYALTDMGLYLAVNKYGGAHDYVVVTNADNGYHPSFFLRTLKADKEIIATHFVQNKKREERTEFALSHIDLGTVVVSTAALRRSNLTFSTSTPKSMIESHPTLSKLEKDVALMRSYHDNDWWFIQKAVHEMNFDAAIVAEALFYHN
mmetsp:Transcript_22607/g.45152  ORF Transcript_22607/g.45152 Transcript_22607/m.45152 type:complete len:764 (-) Transcript_22607:56-2347(-)